MRIRQISAQERFETSFPLTRYAFAPSPARADEIEKARTRTAYAEGSVGLVAEEGGRTLATVTALPMRQNVRGAIYRMAGVASVASDPLARRRGHVRALLLRLLGDLRDAGYAVSVLYPFRPSFYQRFGYARLTRPPTVTFSPADLVPLLRLDLPGELDWRRIGTGYDDYRDVLGRLLTRRHGTAELPDHLARRLRDEDDRWLVTARIDGELAGAVLYRITRHDGELLADDLLTTGVAARTLLLQFFARHVDQVTRVSVTVDPEESPEQWATDLAFAAQARTGGAQAQAPMARVLSVEALAGMPVGPGRLAVSIVDDPLVAGEYLLDGASGALEIGRERPATVPAATLTVPGLSALVYGVLDPTEVSLYGLGEVPVDAAAALRALFPRRRPWVVEQF